MRDTNRMQVRPDPEQLGMLQVLTDPERDRRHSWQQIHVVSIMPEDALQLAQDLCRIAAVVNGRDWSSAHWRDGSTDA